MEPTRFDQLIKEKLAQDKEFHANEISNSKAFVWSSVQTNLNANKTRRWRSLMAAAVFIFLIFSSFLLYNGLQHHQLEMNQLSNKIESLHQKYMEQTKIVSNKDQRISELSREIVTIKNEIQFQETSTIESPKIVYKTDTIIIREVEYITQVPLNMDSSSIMEVKSLKSIESQEVNPLAPADKSNYIFPSFASSKDKYIPNETIKIKFNSFVSN